MPILTSISGVRSAGVTTSALHIAHGMAIAGVKTLLIDLNPDCKASYLLGCVRNADQPSSSDLLQTAKAGDMLGAVVQSVRPGLDVLPAGVDLERRIAVLEESNYSDKDYLLVEPLTRLNASYQAVVIDAPAEPPALKRAVLLNSAILLFPVNGRASLPALSELCRLALSLEFSGTVAALLSRVKPESVPRLRDSIYLELEQLLYAVRGASGEPLFLRTEVLKTVISFRATKNVFFSTDIPTAFDLGTLQQSVDRNHREAFSSIAKNYWALVEELIELVVSSLESPQLEQAAEEEELVLESGPLKSSIRGR